MNCEEEIMKRPFLTIVFILIAVMLSASLAVAEVREGSFEINPFFGYCTGATSPELCHKDVYGLRLGYVITPAIEVEGALEGVGSDAATLYHADALYHLMQEKRLTPFIMAGVGGAHIRPGWRNSYDTVMAEIGAGLKYWITDNVAFRADIRGVQTHFQNSIVTAGITFRFGGKVPMAAPAEAPAPVEQRKKEEAPPAAAPAPEAAPAPAAEAPKPEMPKIVLEDIHFNFDRATLTKAARKILDKNIEIIKQNPDITVQIEGYACAHGRDRYNMILSERRAKTVKEYLVKNGVSADRLTTIAYGETRLAMPEIPTPRNKNGVEAKANRRVHFEVIMK
jgi:OOP family OmpA-OmpF porin